MKKHKKEESGLSKQEKAAVDRIIKRRRPLLEAIGKL